MIRLFVDHPLAPEHPVPIFRDQAHYLNIVMRMEDGARLLIFNGRDGEFEATIEEIGRRDGTLRVIRQTRPLQMPPDLWLLFAPIKKQRTDFIVEKATELGVARILPVQTEFTNSERIRKDRLQAHAMEAAEQCGGTYVPEVEDLQKLDHLLDEWPEDRNLLFCDESLLGAADPLEGEPGKWAILIGPEGGFSDTERARLRDLPFARPVSLGPRILRADTAAVAAITLWQSRLGDWA
ncbi:16S rRNA (uracil(1498)-N(3))-methyltransferase [Pseudoruegeria sp. HB172150]|uniref:16S rRNA (uracil(1498)-N(3))-methyltransferase n=1 Tax=Pseudoruegeria sp. HB172150 TaxID=2721164 RepID=UPI00352C9871